MGKDALVGEAALLDLPHFLLDLVEVFGSERGSAIEIVVEAGIDGRADAELGLGIELEHGRGQQVRGGVSVNLECLGILVGQDLEGRIFLEGAGEVVKLAIDFGHDGGVGQSRTDGFGDIERGGALGDGLLTAVRQGDINAATHRENFSVTRGNDLVIAGKGTAAQRPA